MAVTPSSNGEAQVALCLVKESDTLGSAMWTLLDFVVVQVCQTTPLQAEDPVQKSKEDPGHLMTYDMGMGGKNGHSKTWATSQNNPK